LERACDYDSVYIDNSISATDRRKGDDVKDAIRVAREVNDVASKILQSGILPGW